MRIGEISPATSGQFGTSGGEPAPAPSESRALVTLTSPAQASVATTSYRQAPFLAHLLAVKDQHAQTRERRRADPHEAIAAYRAAASLVR